jgi:hypothetical protein
MSKVKCQKWENFGGPRQILERGCVEGGGELMRRDVMQIDRMKINRVAGKVFIVVVN